MKCIVSLLLISLCFISSCSKPLSQLEQIKQRGELSVLTRYSPTTYYQWGDNYSGVEYELAQQFAEHLGVKLKLIIPDNLGTMMELIKQEQADIAAAGLTITPARELEVRFGPVYQEVTEQLVYRKGNKKPKNLTQLTNGLLEIVADSSHAEQLESFKEDIPQLEWSENDDLTSNHLLELVQLELIDYTVADSNEIIANQTLFPELRVAFDVSDPQPLAWALSKTEDNTLYDEVVSFFEQLDNTGDLDRLIEKYYGHIRRFDYVDTRAIHRKIQTELPKYQSLFEQAADKNNLDWVLLAAISYQESHWNPNAVSSTGVKGLMMLTNATAKEMGVTDRVDPEQSIFAGAAYLVAMKKRLSDRIQEPDRTWLALASYNLGLGHLEDARVLTQKNGKNPDLWADVKLHLPLLSKKKWYSQTRYGYARGGEPVRYIENIRRYYAILLYDETLHDQNSNNDIEQSATTPAAL